MRRFWGKLGRVLLTTGVFLVVMGFAKFALAQYEESPPPPPSLPPSPPTTTTPTTGTGTTGAGTTTTGQPPGAPTVGTAAGAGAVAGAATGAAPTGPETNALLLLSTIGSVGLYGFWKLALAKKRTRI